MKLAVYLHIHYYDIYLEYLPKLKEYLLKYDFIFTYTDNVSKEDVDTIKKDFPSSVCNFVENEGRDIKPFYTMSKQGHFDKYDYICKIHTKKSPHRSDGIEWGRDLVFNLLNFDPSNTKAENEKGLIWAIDKSILQLSSNIDDNLESLDKYSSDWRDANFVGGTMFWFSNRFLKLVKENINPDLFEPEPLGRDGSYAHVVERLLGVWASSTGDSEVIVPIKHTGHWGH